MDQVNSEHSSNKLLIAKIIFFYIFIPFKFLFLLLFLSLFGINFLPTASGAFLSQLFAIIVLLLLFGFYTPVTLKKLNSQQFSVKKLLLLSPLAILSRLPLPFLLLFPLLANNPQSIDQSIKSQWLAFTNIPSSNYFDQFLVVSSIVILAPILEELFHRGIIFNLLKRKLPVIVSIVLSAFLFSIMHGNLVLALSTFLPGLLFAYSYYRFGNILYPILLHVIVNAFPFLLGIIWR